MIGIGIGNNYSFTATAGSGDIYTGRMSIDSITGKMIEYQSGAYNNTGGLISLKALEQNAINAGYLPQNIWVTYVTASEYEAQMNLLKPPPKTLLEEAQSGNRGALRELIDKKTNGRPGNGNSYDKLNPEEQQKVIKIMLGYNETLD